MFKSSIKKSNTAADQLHRRLTSLNNYHAYAVYENVCCGLFEHHKLLLSFQICVQLLVLEKKIDMDQYEFLLNGGIEEPKRKQHVTTQRPGMYSTSCNNPFCAETCAWHSIVYCLFYFHLVRLVTENVLVRHIGVE